MLKKIIYKIIDINQKYTVWAERCRLNIFDTRNIRKYNNTIKLDKNYKKDIKKYWKKYKNINTKFHEMYLNVGGGKRCTNYSRSNILSNSRLLF